MLSRALVGSSNIRSCGFLYKNLTYSLNLTTTQIYPRLTNTKVNTTRQLAKKVVNSAGAEDHIQKNISTSETFAY